MIKSSMNYDYTVQKMEVGGGVSMTVPDQAMPLRQILARHVKGLPIDDLKTPIYEDEGEDVYNGIDPRTLDFAEKQEFRERAEQELADIKADLNEKAAKRKAAKATKPADSAGKQESGSGEHESVYPKKLGSGQSPAAGGDVVKSPTQGDNE